MLAVMFIGDLADGCLLQAVMLVGKPVAGCHVGR